MPRAPILALVCLACASCASGPFSQATSSSTSLDLAEHSYVMAERTSRNSRCYTRVIRGAPVDQVCQEGDLLRYSPGASVPASEPIPVYVLALFESAPVEIAPADDGER